MLSIHTTSPRPPLNDAVGTPHIGSSSSSDPAGFSSLLRQSQTTAAPALPPAAAPRPPAAATHNDAAARTPDRDHAPAASADHDTEPRADTDDAAPANDLAARARALPRPRLRGADAAPRAARPLADAAGDAKPADPAAPGPGASAGAPAGTSAALDPNLAQWLAALQRPASTAKTGDHAQAAADAGTPVPLDANPSTPSARTDAATIDAGPKDKAGHAATRFAADALDVAATRTAPRATEAAAPSAPHTPPGIDGVLASSLQAVPASPREAAAPASVAIATPVDAPDFAQALSLQLSVFAKDGVQHAELHLNPAEMGPVSVQIVMDGTQARIDFGADAAATRHAIEAGLPELASALRDAGFTLAGGGVSQHSGGRGDTDQPEHGPAQHGPRPVSDEHAARVGSAARRIVTNGGVDLYA